MDRSAEQELEGAGCFDLSDERFAWQEVRLRRTFDQGVQRLVLSCRDGERAADGAMLITLGLRYLSGDGDLYALLATGNGRFESKKVISEIPDPGGDVTKTQHSAPRDDRYWRRRIRPAVAQELG